MSVCCPRPPKPPADEDTADYVLVGLGTAGAPLARYLTEDLKTSVIVLEAGVDESGNAIVRLPFITPQLNLDPSFNFFRPLQSRPPPSNPPKGIDPGALQVLVDTAGRMWGGSSGNNYLFGIRGTKSMYDQWGAIDPQWLYNNLLPIMKFTETYTPNGTVANPAQRGDSGPIDITQGPPVNAEPFFQAFGGATATPFITDYNDPTLGEVGVSAGQHYVTPVGNLRSWAQDFLPVGTIIDADGNGLGGRKLQIRSEATAVKVLIDNTNTARGVRYFVGEDPNDVREVKARKKVILCAGGIADAQLLQLSGVGPAAVLEAVGIDVKVANDNVGSHAQSHYGPVGFIPVDPPSAPNIPLNMNFAELFTDAGLGDGVRRIEYIVVATSTATSPPIPPLVPAQVLVAMNPNGFAQQGISIIAFVLNAARTGTVSVVSTDPTVDPLIDPGYYSDPTDLFFAVQALKQIADVSVLFTGNPPIYPPPTHYQAAQGGTAPNDALLFVDALTSRPIACGIVGTCRMGTSVADGVVDGNLDVFGVKSLSVASNSIVPNTVSVARSFSAYVIGLQKAKIEGAVGLP